MTALWSDTKKWKMDLLKNALSFTLAGLISLFVVDHVQLSRTAEKAKADAFYSTRLRAVDEYRSLTSTVRWDALVAWQEALVWNGISPESALMQKYTFETYARLLVNLRILENLFPDLIIEINATRGAIDKAFQEFIALNGKRAHDKLNYPQDHYEKQHKEFLLLTQEADDKSVLLLIGFHKTLFPFVDNRIN